MFKECEEILGYTVESHFLKKKIYFIVPLLVILTKMSGEKSIKILYFVAVYNMFKKEHIYAARDNICYQ